MNRTFILGGYFIVIPAMRSSYMDNEVVPDKVMTVSNCICDILPDIWGLNWVKNRDKEILHAKNLLKFNNNEFLELEEWVTKQFDKESYGWQYGFRDLDTAREFKTRFLSRVSEAYLISIGLEKEEANIFIKEEKPSNGTGETLVFSVLNQGNYMDLDNLFGFDVIGYDLGSFHSYLCNGLEKPFYRDLNIKPGAYGLFAKYEDALIASDYLRNEKVGAEPALWQPWAVCVIEKV